MYIKRFDLPALSASSAKDSLVHSYGRSFNGFAAKLTEEEAEIIAGKRQLFYTKVLIVMNEVKYRSI